MSSLATTSPLAERIRVAVACFRLAEKATERVYVLLEAAAEPYEAKLSDLPGIKRIVARQVYAGEHKNLDGKWTVVVGQDPADAATTVSVPVQHRAFEVIVRATPFAGIDVPFEGIVDLKSVPLER